MKFHRTEQELQKICSEHEILASQILGEEEELIASHKQHLDEIVETVKQVIIDYFKINRKCSYCKK